MSSQNPGVPISTGNTNSTQSLGMSVPPGYSQYGPGGQGVPNQPGYSGYGIAGNPTAFPTLPGGRGGFDQPNHMYGMQSSSNSASQSAVGLRENWNNAGSYQQGPPPPAPKYSQPWISSLIEEEEQESDFLRSPSLTQLCTRLAARYHVPSVG